jgi:hypothetical protein
MEFAALKWWHWMLIALIVGIAIGKLRESAQSEIHGNYIEGFGYFFGNQKILRFTHAGSTTVMANENRFIW